MLSIQLKGIVELKLCKFKLEQICLPFTVLLYVVIITIKKWATFQEQKDLVVKM